MNRPLRQPLAAALATILTAIILEPSLVAAENCLPRTPQIVISAININNDTKDWIELTMLDDATGGNGTTLTNWRLTTLDQPLTTLNNISLASGGKITLTDMGNIVATTDQAVLINDRGEIVDAVCWANKTPAKAEQDDFKKLGANWNGATIDTCIKSDDLKRNQTIRRTAIADTNTNADWTVEPLLSAIVTTPTTVLAAPTTAPVAPPVAPVAAPAPTSDAPIATNEITISELMPDPDGDDAGNEWIELKNASDHAVRLTGWQLDDIDGGSKPYTFTVETIGAESFLVMSDSATKIILNNTGDSARLINPGGTVTSQTSYTKIATGKSFARIGTVWNESTPTPGRENIAIDAAATAADASASSSSLDASSDASPGASSTSPASGTPSDAPGAPPSPIEISEVFPNPTGPDAKNEWIELYNKTDQPISLDGWTMTNTAGKQFTIHAVAIAPHGYVTIASAESKITIKNDHDEITIIDDDDTVRGRITIDEAPENASFAKIETQPLDVTDPTPTEQTPPTNTDGVQTNIIDPQSWVPTAHAESATAEWLWTNEISKGRENPRFYTIIGTIAALDEIAHTITIRNGNNQQRIIAYDAQRFPAIHTMANENQPVIITVNKRKNEALELEAIASRPQEKSASPSAKTATSFITIAIATATLAALGYIGYRKLAPLARVT